MLIVHKLMNRNSGWVIYLYLCYIFLSLGWLNWAFIAAGDRHSDLDIDLDLDDSDDELLEAPSFLKDLENAMQVKIPISLEWIFCTIPEVMNCL